LGAPVESIKIATAAVKWILSIEDNGIEQTIGKRKKPQEYHR
jgi:hypothetical protein